MIARPHVPGKLLLAAMTSPAFGQWGRGRPCMDPPIRQCHTEYNTLIKFAPMHQEAPCHITHDESRLIAFCPEMPRNSSPNHFVPLSTFTCTFFNEYVRWRLWLWRHVYTAPLYTCKRSSAPVLITTAVGEWRWYKLRVMYSSSSSSFYSIE